MSDSKKMPTSPHLQIYSWSIGSLTSIMHRLTGILLYVSVIIISWYIVYYTYQIGALESQEHCDCLMTKLMNILAIGASIALTFSLYFHFFNGIRHLFWDIGKGFDKKQAQTNGLLVIAASKIFTVLTIISVIYFNYY